jgi:hypothetical protein
MNFPIAELIEETEDRMSEIVGTLERVPTDKIGLDRRAGFVWVSREGIVVDSNMLSTLEYYGGFEYVHRDYVHKLGGFTFYSRDDERVDEAVNYYMNGGKLSTNDEDVEDEEDEFYPLADPRVEDAE